MKKRILLLTITLTALSVLPLIATAQTTCTGTGFCALAPAPGGTAFSNLYASGSLSQYLNALFKFAISVGGILAVLRLGYAGYMYMFDSDRFATKTKAREMISDAVIGLLLLLGIWIILHQINPNILNLSILQDFTSSGTSIPASQYIAPGSTAAF